MMERGIEMSITIEISSPLAEEIQSILPHIGYKDEKEFVVSVIQDYLGGLREQIKVMEAQWNLSFDSSKIESILKIARLEIQRGANHNVISLILKAFASELNRLFSFIDQMSNHNALFRQGFPLGHAPDEVDKARVRYTKRLLLKLLNASKNLQSEAVLTEHQLSLLEQGVRLLKEGNLNADILKEYSTQLTKAEIDTTVHTLSTDGVDKLIELYMEKLQKWD